MDYRLDADSGQVSLPAPDDTQLDVLIEDHGSLHLFRPLTAAATTWLREHTDGTWLGPSLVVEPRYSLGLVEGLVDAGFTPASSYTR